MNRALKDTADKEIEAETDEPELMSQSQAVAQTRRQRRPHPQRLTLQGQSKLPTI